MPKCPIKLNKTIKKSYSTKAEDLKILHRPNILRSQSLPNPSEINFEQETIAHIVNCKDSYRNLSSSTSLQQKIETDPEKIYPSCIINQIIHVNMDDHSNENTHTTFSGAGEDN